MPPSDKNTTTAANHSDPASPRRPQDKSQVIPHHIRIKNRRKRYLEAHPEYFGPSLESADPLLYDRLIRTHQTAAERTSERKAKGFAGTLEADLLRSEAKLDEVKTRSRPSASAVNGDVGEDSEQGVHDQTGPSRNGGPVLTNGYESTNGNGTSNGSPSTSALTPTAAPAPTFTPLPVPPNDFTTLTRDEADQYWIETMTARFVRGDDQDFDYDIVDRDEGLDDVRGEERDLEEEWFDREEEGFLVASDSEDGGREGKGRELKGETGVQDF